MTKWALCTLLGCLLTAPAASAQSDATTTQLPWRVGDECVVRDTIKSFEVYATESLTGPTRIIAPGTRLKVFSKDEKSAGIRTASVTQDMFISPALLLVQCQVERTAWRDVWKKEAVLETPPERPELSTPPTSAGPQAANPNTWKVGPVSLDQALEEPPTNLLENFTYAAWTTTGVALSTGMVLGMMAKQAEKEAVIGQVGVQRHAQRAQSYALGANIGYAVAGTGVLTAIILMSFDDGSSQHFGLAPHTGSKGISVVGTW